VQDLLERLGPSLMALQTSHDRHTLLGAAASTRGRGLLQTFGFRYKGGPVTFALRSCLRPAETSNVQPPGEEEEEEAVAEELAPPTTNMTNSRIVRPKVAPKAARTGRQRARATRPRSTAGRWPRGTSGGGLEIVVRLEGHRANELAVRNDERRGVQRGAQGWSTVCALPGRGRWRGGTRDTLQQ
jgi:hypothetical protein